MNKALYDSYVEVIVHHFIKQGYEFTIQNVRSAVRDLVFFQYFYDSVDDCLDEIYPKEKD